MGHGSGECDHQSAHIAGYAKGRLILRRAIWAIIVEQGKLCTLCEQCFEWGVAIAIFWYVLSIVPL